MKKRKDFPINLIIVLVIVILLIGLVWFEAKVQSVVAMNFSKTGQVIAEILGFLAYLYTVSFSFAGITLPRMIMQDEDVYYKSKMDKLKFVILIVIIMFVAAIIPQLIFWPSLFFIAK